MFHVFPQPLDISDGVIEEQFKEIPGLSLEDEIKLWTKYDSMVDKIGKEKLRIFKELEMDVLGIWEGVRAESNKSTDLYTMNVMLQRMQCAERGISDDQLYSRYLQMKINDLKKVVERYETCFKAFFNINRKRYNYGLKVFGSHRTDIPVDQRFTPETINNFKETLIKTTEIYEKNVRRMRINLSSTISHPIIRQLLDLWIRTFEKQKRINFDEIQYYEQLYQSISDVDSATRVG